MVTEQAALDIITGKESQFQHAFEAALPHLAGSPGCRSVQLLRGVEHPSRFLLLVEWNTIEDHTVGFRQSDAFKSWVAAVGPYFDGAPNVEHFAR